MESPVIPTVLSQVDGALGRLTIRGKRIEALSGSLTFEEMTALLWHDLAPENLSPDEVRHTLGLARARVFAWVRPLLERVDLLSPDSAAIALRVALAANAADDGLACTALVPVALATAWRLHRGMRPLEPDPTLGHGADFLRMLNEEPPPLARVEALDAYLVTVAEHDVNASTFTARVVASTGATLAGAVNAAYCALQGPLHGGAPGPVLDMLDAVGEASRADEWMAAQLREGKRLMGFGHRIYRVRDPRADVLKRALERLRQTHDSDRLRFAEAVEGAALRALAAHKPNRPLQTNVEYYTALLLEAVGLPRQLFTPVFAMGRVAGWIAHVYEQRRTGRLIRPQGQYLGTPAEEVETRAIPK